MAEPFLSEIRMFSFGFAPRGWALCNGQLLSINQNQALFSLLGTTYGGNGITTFALPNLEGRVPIHMGNGVVLGQQAGEANVTINISELPQHTHIVQANSAANASGPSSTAVPGGGGVEGYGPTPATPMNPAIIGPTGSSQPHNNMQPYLTINFSIALQGIFPSRD